MDLSSKETSSFNEVNIMKKRYSIGLLLVMSTMLISCGGEASTSTSSFLLVLAHLQPQLLPQIQERLVILLHLRKRMSSVSKDKKELCMPVLI